MKPNHGEIEILNSQENINLIKRNKFAHLACHNSKEVYLVPVSYIFENGYIYSHSKPGHKIDIMRKNPDVCFQVEEVQDFFHWKSVVIQGKFEELFGNAATTAMRRLIQEFTKDEKRRSELEIDFAAQLESSIIYRIKIEESSGRAEGVH